VKRSRSKAHMAASTVKPAVRRKPARSIAHRLLDEIHAFASLSLEAGTQGRQQLDKILGALAALAYDVRTLCKFADEAAKRDTKRAEPEAVSTLDQLAGMHQMIDRMRSDLGKLENRIRFEEQRQRPPLDMVMRHDAVIAQWTDQSADLKQLRGDLVGLAEKVRALSNAPAAGYVSGAFVAEVRGQLRTAALHHEQLRAELVAYIDSTNTRVRELERVREPRQPAPEICGQCGAEFEGFHACPGPSGEQER